MQKFILLIKTKKKFLEDVFLNLLSNGVPLLVLQLIVLPGVNAGIGEEAYGLVITLVSIFTLVTSTSAGSLNNVRLLLDSTYRRENVSGDFNIIQALFSLVNVLIVLIISSIYVKVWTPIEAALLALATVLICSEGYYSVGFRLQLNYRRVLIQKLLLSIGYYIGYCLFTITKVWLLIYIVGYLLDLIYVLCMTELIKEPWRITKLFKLSVKNESVLIIAVLLGGLSSHIDRLLIYPIYGGLITSTYFVATLLGKGISLATFPISGVLLSYFSKKNRIENNTVKMMMAFSWFSGIICYICCLIISRPLLGYLYPSIVDDALHYVPITLLGAVIGVQNTILSPVILKFCRITLQIWISFFNTISYLFISALLMSFFGLMGFCISGVLVTLMKYCIYLYLYRKDIRL